MPGFHSLRAAWLAHYSLLYILSLATAASALLPHNYSSRMCQDHTDGQPQAIYVRRLFVPVSVMNLQLPIRQPIFFKFISYD